METIEDLFKIRAYENEIPTYAKSYELPSTINKLYIVCKPKHGEIEIKVIPKNWRVKPYTEIYSCSVGINIICLCKQNKPGQKTIVSVFNVDTVLEREYYKAIDFSALDKLWLAHDMKYDNDKIFYMSLEEEPCIKNMSLKWNLFKTLAFNKIPTKVLYQYAGGKLKKQDIRRMSVNPMQEFMLAQTGNTKRCRTRIGKRLHEEALQSGRKYYSIKRESYYYLKEKLDEKIFNKIFHSYWAPRFIWLRDGKEDSDSDWD